MSPKEQLDQLVARLDQLSRRQQATSDELIRLREDIRFLRLELRASAELPDQSTEEWVPDRTMDQANRSPPSIPPPLPKLPISKPVVSRTGEPASGHPKKTFDWEEFIGGNLINKIGILILIIGLGLFAKYAIDKGYFPPVVRLVGSFLAGLVLVLIGYWLKPKYKTYSAVLFSGGIAVLYFSAYGGNAFYDPVLLPKVTSFILMVVFTVVTVLAALIYNLEIIALLGLVGAYAVPLLLSDDSENYKFFLSYIAIINAGVLLVCLRKHWRVTLYSTMLLTWIIFAFWVLVEYNVNNDTSTAWLFNSLFFGLFYGALLGYNRLKGRTFTIDYVLFLTLNAFVFYGLGTVLLDNSGQQVYQGGFTLGNGLLHLAIAYLGYWKLVDKKLFFTISGMFWIFLTIAIGVQFGASTRALLWFGEAALFFGIGRRFNIPFYEVASYMMLLLAGSLLSEYWMDGYYSNLVHLPLFSNAYFISTTLVIAILGSMLWMTWRWKGNEAVRPLSNSIISVLFIVLLYIAFFNEWYHQLEQTYWNSEINGIYQEDLQFFKAIWLLYYSLTFVLGMGLINQLFIKRKAFTQVLVLLSLMGIGAFLAGGLYGLNELRYSYLHPELSPAFEETSYWIWIRYIGYILLGAVTFLLYRTVYRLKLHEKYSAYFELLVYFLILVVLTNELSTVMTLGAGVATASLAHNVGKSILWAIFSLVLVFVGFKKRSKLKRVAGILLFGLTLAKIFLLDLVDISTESRIFLFIVVGVLLLLTSFLYQKYADVLLGEQGTKEDRRE